MKFTSFGWTSRTPALAWTSSSRASISSRRRTSGRVAGTCPQAQLALDGGYIWNCIALIFSDHTCHTVRVRLYRPGYELIEVEAWTQPGDLLWLAAANASDQEIAVDDLLAPTGIGGWGKFHWTPRSRLESKMFAHLRPGWIAPQHRKSLAFAAPEYERVACLYEQVETPDHSASERCRQKARWLRELPMTTVPLICPRLPWVE
jgi:hypothetical protein